MLPCTVCVLGMAPISCDRKTSVEDFGVNIDNFYFRGGTSGRIGKSTNQTLWPLFDANLINEALRCKQNATHWKVRYVLIVARNAFFRSSHSINCKQQMSSHNAIHCLL